MRVRVDQRRQPIRTRLYRLTYVPNMVLTWSSQVNPACSAQSLVVPDLIEGQDYLFRIRAENRFGFGPSIETPQGTRTRDPVRKSFYHQVPHQI